VKVLRDKGIRVELDDRAEKIGYKIREARNERVPYMIILGEKEQQDATITVRSRNNGEEGSVVLYEYIARIREEIQNKLLDI
jgi:threonyl-tRNA synthetase